MNRTSITKFEAARRQLRVGIRMMLDGADEVCVHTLIGAASNMLSDIVESLHPERSWDRRAQEATQLTRVEYFRIMREAQNFFKHAKSDLDATFSLDPIDTESLAFWAVMNAGELDELSMEESVFQLWYIASHAPDFVDDSGPIKTALAAFGDIRGKSRSERIESARRVLQAHGTDTDVLAGRAIAILPK